jgi:glucose-6-phosphate 1-dehydrogenase
MIHRLTIFGGTGDLSGRYLLPGLVALGAAGHLGDHFQLTCADRSDGGDDQFRSWVAAELERHAGAWPANARKAIATSARYRRADVTDPADVASAIAGDGPIAVYLALPPALFAPAVSTLHRAGLPPGSQIVLEKPFGEDLDRAIELNRLLADLVPEDAVFRVDHFLAMTTVENVLGSRLANRVLEPLWNSAHIAEVDIVWHEVLTLEGRAGYYDNAGALKDMV